jgi:hypothetical protein
MVVPSRASEPMSALKPRVAFASSPFSGSSKKIARGLCRSAAVMTTRCRVPFEYAPSCSRRSVRSLSSKNSAKRRMRVVRQAIQRGDQVEILPAGERLEDGAGLRHVADDLLHLDGLTDDVEAEDLRRARRRRQHARQHLDGGRLPGAVGSEESDELPGRDLEIETADRLDLAVSFREPAESDHVSAMYHHRWPDTSKWRGQRAPW